MSNKFIVITSIFAPTLAVRSFAALHDWKLLVVGDRKTPLDWKCDGVSYLSPDKQLESGCAIATALPWNHYARKMVGYVHAIRSGAEIIVDTDDDNIPKASWAMPEFEGVLSHSDQSGYLNVYKYFTNAQVWPRGLPLRHLRDHVTLSESLEPARIGVWQFLADEDPDVDAIYRLVFNQPVFFESRAPIVLRPGTICPFNSQNTAFRKEVFPLLYLPAFVNFRYTDILRSIVAQPILWKFGYRLGFGEATVRQERNPHDFMRDFVDEIPMYQHGERAFDLVQSSIDKAETISDALKQAYFALEVAGIVERREIELLNLWLKDLEG
jgi:hypothetical protein